MKCSLFSSARLKVQNQKKTFSLLKNPPSTFFPAILKEYAEHLLLLNKTPEQVIKQSIEILPLDVCVFAYEIFSHARGKEWVLRCGLTNQTKVCFILWITVLCRVILVHILFCMYLKVTFSFFFMLPQNTNGITFFFF